MGTGTIKKKRGERADRFVWRKGDIKIRNKKKKPAQAARPAPKARD